MGKFVFAYQGGGMPETEAEGQAIMAAWMAWFGELGEAVVDGGAPFGASKTLASSGKTSDGAASALTGYSIVSAADLAAATKLAAGCPNLKSGGSVDIYEAREM